VKITAVRVFELEGRMREGLAVYETARSGFAPGQSSPHRWPFTEIETDEGVTGLTFGGSPDVKAAGALLIGEDPLRVEYLWEKLYGVSQYRQRVPTIAVLDLALWDLIGKVRGEPVHRLLGGPTRDRIRAYAGMLGFSTEPAAAARASAAWAERGFTALKWYLPHNALDGPEGMARNVALIREVRQAVGDDVQIMVDWLLAGPRANSLLYAIELARRLEEFRPTWIEEPLNFDDLDAHVALARATRIPLAFGEHFYTRWQLRQIIESGAPTVVQPDPVWAGGITEMRKIIAVASTYGTMLVPHGNESCRNALHLLFAQPERICPLAEWGVRINHDVQYFYQDFYEPRDGYFEPPDGPGFGYELDPDKIMRRTEL
jgi:L-alanine-DL-glutamate epimerase-like enolase superfamily enzyme